MGDYISTANISSMVQDLVIGTDGAISTTDAEFIISLIEGEVNGILYSLGVMTPITTSDSPRAFKFIRALCAQGIVAMIQADIHALSDDTEGSREAAFWRRYDRGLVALQERGGAYLIDAISLTGDFIRNVPAAIGLHNIDSYSRLSTLTRLRYANNEIAVGRSLRRYAGYFEGGLL